MKNLFTYLLIALLPVLSAVMALCSSFIQTLPFMKDSTFTYKLLTSEFWASMNVIVFIPSLRIANKYLNPAQLMLYGYLVSFCVQIFSNHYMFINLTSYDDYVAMIIMFIAMVISAYKIFG